MRVSPFRSVCKGCSCIADLACNMMHVVQAYESAVFQVRERRFSYVFQGRFANSLVTLSNLSSNSCFRLSVIQLPSIPLRQINAHVFRSKLKLACTWT